MKWTEFKANIINIETYRISKICLSCYEDKNLIPEDGCRRLSHFYRSTYKKSNHTKNIWKLILIVALNTITIILSNFFATIITY